MENQSIFARFLLLEQDSYPAGDPLLLICATQRLPGTRHVVYPIGG